MQNFSFPKMENRQFKFSPRKPYDLVAESAKRADKLREATSKTLQFSN